MEKVQFKGSPIYLAGRDYIIPSMSLRMMEKHDELLKSFGTEATLEMTPKELFRKYLPVIGDALRRNYHEITDEQLVDWIDFDSGLEAIKIIQGVTGYTRVTSVGEAQPVASTGATS